MPTLTRTYTEAATQFPGEPMESACTGSLFQDKYHAELQHALDGTAPEYKNFSQEEREEFGPHLARLVAWKKLDAWDRHNIPMTIKGQIIDSFTLMNDDHSTILKRFEQERNYQLQNKETLRKLYQSVHLDRDLYFNRDALKTVADTLDAISTLPELSHFQKNWDTLPSDDKIDFLQKIHNIHAAVLGLHPGLVTTFTEGPFYPLNSKKEKPVYTLMRVSEHAIEINMSTNPEAPEQGPVGLFDFTNCMGSILHEGTHLRDAASHEAQNEGMHNGYNGIFLGSERSAGSYLTAKDDGEEAYLSNPTEVHAHFVGELTAGFFKITDPDMQSNYIAGLRAHAWENEKMIQQDHEISRYIRDTGLDKISCSF